MTARIEDFLPQADRLELLAQLKESSTKLDAVNRLKETLHSFLGAKRNAGELHPFSAQHMARSSWMMSDFNAFVQSNPTTKKQANEPPEQLTHGLAWVIATKVSMAKFGVGQFGDEAFCSMVNEGRFEGSDMLSSMSDLGFKCPITDEQLVPAFDPGWQPSLMLMDFKKKPPQLIPAPPPPEPRVVSLHIPSPSGRLLIGDWFRIDEFTKAVDDHEKKFPHFSVNSDNGKFIRMRILESMGVATFFVGNTSPDIWLTDETLVIASSDTAPVHGAKHDGQVCTDLWWTTAVDVDVLKKIVATQTGSEQSAAEIVDQYILENRPHEVKVDVPEMHVHAPIYTSSDMRSFQSDAGPEYQGAPEVFGLISVMPMSFTYAPLAEQSAEKRLETPPSETQSAHAWTPS